MHSAESLSATTTPAASLNWVHHNSRLAEEELRLDETAAPELLTADLDVFAEALAARDRRARLLRAVDCIAAERLGVVVFSASACSVESLVVERVYSSCPATYPLGVKTNKRETSWGRQVLQRKQIFVGEGSLAMAAAFDDQANMERAGVRSIINVPIVLDQKCLAVLNFGFHNDRVAPQAVTMTRLFAFVVSAAFVA